MLNFPVIDVTHNFSRNQNEVAIESLKEQGKQISEENTQGNDNAPLKPTTLEGAIKLFSEPSVKVISPEFSKQISEWLHTCLMTQGGKKE